MSAVYGPLSPPGKEALRWASKGDPRTQVPLRQIHRSGQEDADYLSGPRRIPPITRIPSPRTWLSWLHQRPQTASGEGRLFRRLLRPASRNARAPRYALFDRVRQARGSLPQNWNHTHQRTIPTEERLPQILLAAACVENLTTLRSVSTRTQVVEGIQGISGVP